MRPDTVLAAPAQAPASATLAARARAAGGEVLAADLVVAAYNILVGGIWLAVASRVGYAIWLGAAHLVAAALPLGLRRWRRELSPVAAALCEYYPLVWLVGFWVELDYLIPLLHPTLFDTAVRRMDVALFGADWGREWLVRAPWLWLSEPMHFCYMLFFPLVVLPPIVLGFTGRREGLRETAFRLALVYLVNCLVYIAFPVAGPEHFVPPGAPLRQGLFFGLTGPYLGVGDSLGTAFPSTHVAATVTILFVAWRWFRPWIAGAMTLLTVALTVSTVYTQQHYVLDAVAGALVALALQAAAPELRRRLERWKESQR